MKKLISTMVLAIVATAGWAQTRIWNNIVTGYSNVPFVKVTKVVLSADSTEVFLHFDMPSQAAGRSQACNRRETGTTHQDSSGRQGRLLAGFRRPARRNLEGFRKRSRYVARHWRARCRCHPHRHHRYLLAQHAYWRLVDRIHPESRHTSSIIIRCGTS